MTFTLAAAAAAVAVFVPSDVAEPPVVVTHRELAFTLTVPSGFVAVPDPAPTPDDLYTFARGDVAASDAVFLQVMRMRGTIGREPFDLNKVPAALKASKEQVAWGKHALEVVRTEPPEGVIAFLAQVPLKPEAIQLTIAGPPAREAEMKETMRAAVAGVAGQSNWLTEQERADALRSGMFKLVRLFAIIGVLLALVAFAVRQARRR